MGGRYRSIKIYSPLCESTSLFDSGRIPLIQKENVSTGEYFSRTGIQVLTSLDNDRLVYTFHTSPPFTFAKPMLHRLYTPEGCCCVLLFG